MKVPNLDVVGRIRDVGLIDDSMSCVSDLEMHRNGTNEGPMMVGVAESSKSPMFDIGEDIDKREKQMENKLVAFHKPQGGQ